MINIIKCITSFIDKWLFYEDRGLVLLMKISAGNELLLIIAWPQAPLVGADNS